MGFDIQAGYVASGSWSIDGVCESYTWTGRYYFNLGQAPNNTLVWVPVTVVLWEPGCEPKSESCLQTRQYFMYTLRDANQPSTWQPYCYIISNNGTPSAESQARVCSVPGSDHVFSATNIPYGGWVSADCNGTASYGWPDWQPAWYRPGFAK